MTNNEQGFLNDIQFELISQTSIVHYIEQQFEKLLKECSRFLEIDIPENLYDNNISFMEELSKICNEQLEKISNSYIADKALPPICKKRSDENAVWETIDYCVEAISDEQPISIEELKNQLEDVNEANGDDIYSFTDAELLEIMDAAQIVYNAHINNELEEQEDAILLLTTTIKLINNASLSNIYRQSFINIFSIFDAYVFDNLKEYFYKHPEQLDIFLDIKNSDRIKASIDDVILFSSIEELKRDLIQKQFNGRYISELIRKLHKFKPSVFENIDHSVLLEMIERRNIHLHNKGYVDEKYCDSVNLYALKIGEYAYIDSKYLFITVFNTLSQFSVDFEKVFLK